MPLVCIPQLYVFVNLPSTLSPASVPLPPESKGGGGHTRVRMRGWGSQFQRLEKSLALCLLCGVPCLPSFMMLYPSLSAVQFVCQQSCLHVCPQFGSLFVSSDFPSVSDTKFVSPNSNEGTYTVVLLICNVRFKTSIEVKAKKRPGRFIVINLFN